MKIGIYTFHTPHNVGAMLQAYALGHVLKGMGAEIEFVYLYTRESELADHHKTRKNLVRSVLRSAYMLFHPQIKRMERKFDTFHELMPVSCRFYTKEEYESNPIQYDIHLVGSDQIWNLQKGYDYSSFYFLGYLPTDAVRMSYASSFGTTEIVKDLDKVATALSKFTHLSVREDSAVQLIESITDQECEQVLDPTLLLDSHSWNSIIENKPIIKGKYIFFYGVNEDENTWHIIKKAKDILGLPIVGYPGLLRPKYHFDKYYIEGGPLEFLNLLKYSELVITSSFHGLAFSINFEKKFMLVRYGERMERMTSLIKVVGAENYIATKADDVEKILNYENENNIKINLEQARESSYSWIKRNIINYKHSIQYED